MLRLATINDIDYVMEIISDAKKYLKDQNSLQWNQPDGYPRKEDLLKDINNKSCYVYIENNQIIGTMSIIYEPDENYDVVYEGAWNYNEPYASIHRIATLNSHHHKGIGKKMMILAEDVIKSNKTFLIRIDTHKNNIPMKKTIESSGYNYCGIIKLKRSNEDNLRNAYEKKINIG